MDNIWQDARFAVRTLLKAPAFTLVVILTLALGIGANTAIFSLTDQVLLRLLPVRDPERLVVLDGPGPFQGRTFNNSTFSYPMYRDFRDQNTVFDGVIARFPAPLTLTAGGQSERVSGELVTGNFFDVLGVRPIVGRLFSLADDTTPGAHPVAVLSYDYWTRRFAQDRSVLDLKVALNGVPMTIVGVAPRGFHGIIVGSSPDVMVPVMMKAHMTPTWDDLLNRRSRWLTIMARVKNSMTRAQAEASMNVLYRQINEVELKEMPAASSKTFSTRFLAKHLFLLDGQKGQSDLREQFSTPILVLMGMVGVVLLIACANVANLLLARGAARQKEVAIRMALGAGRVAIVRQRLIESALLAVAGAALGLVFARWTGSLLINTLPFDSAATVLSSVPDGRVIAFALAVTAVTVLLFGLAPALQSTRPALTATLKDEAGSVVGGTGHARFRRGLVVAQVCLSVLLLTGAALFARSLYNLRTLDPGFETDRLLGFSINPSLSGYSRERSIALFERMQDELSRLPGVDRAAASVISLMSDDNWSATVRIEGYQPKEGQDMNPDIDAVSPGYFSTLGQALLGGRDFTINDSNGAPRVAIVNETFVKTYFGTENPLGRHIGWGRDKSTPMEIIGVVKDAKMASMRGEVKRFVYTPYMQEDELGQVTFYVRSRGAATEVAQSARAVTHRIDPNLPVFNMKSLPRTIDDLLFIERMVAALSVAFGVLATLLAAIGLYGVMSYSVTRRTREIGIRMALGAERQTVMWMVLGEVATMAGIGVAAGIPLAFLLSRIVQSQLFGLSAHDPVALTGAAAVLISVALIAGFLPARRATRVDPMLALRYE
jgi:predicted permease